MNWDQVVVREGETLDLFCESSSPYQWCYWAHNSTQPPYQVELLSIWGNFKSNEFSGKLVVFWDIIWGDKLLKRVSRIKHLFEHFSLSIQSSVFTMIILIGSLESSRQRLTRAEAKCEKPLFGDSRSSSTTCNYLLDLQNFFHHLQLYSWSSKPATI